MLSTALKLSRGAMTAGRATGISLLSRTPSLLSPSSSRFFCGPKGSNASPVALQMIDYALSHARSLKSGNSGSAHLQPLLLYLFSSSGLNYEKKIRCPSFSFVDESYAQGLLVLEQCLSTHSTEVVDATSQNSRAMVLLAMSTLLFERFYISFFRPPLGIISLLRTV